MLKLGSEIIKRVAGIGNSNFRHSFSQCGEDMIVDYIFKAIGVEKPGYIDIGAYHPENLSNTAYFYYRGSSGINIEPDPLSFPEFVRKRKRDINLNVGVGEAEAVLDFYCMSAGSLNTFSKEEAERLSAKYGYSIRKKIPVFVRTLQDIIDKESCGVFPDFLTIDIEGLDESVLRQIDYEHCCPKVICVETVSFEEDGSGKKNVDLIDFLKQNGYMVFADTYINSIFVKESLWLRK